MQKFNFSWAYQLYSCYKSDKTIGSCGAHLLRFEVEICVDILAIRIYRGQIIPGMIGEEALLSWDNFPHTGISKVNKPNHLLFSQLLE